MQAVLTRFLGSILSISIFGVPSLLLAPNPVLVRQWQLSFDRGKIVNPAIAIVSACTYFWLSWSLYGGLNHPKAEMYALSAICTLGIWPYTIFGMMSTNKKLFKKYEEMKGLSLSEKATEVGLPKGESTKELVDRWGALNVGRGFLPLVGAVLGLWATLN
ncbi:hypothetical protein P7C71_g5232, partial [Lecanoromycetidae sp. Uapishka_2]